MTELGKKVGLLEKTINVVERPYLPHSSLNSSNRGIVSAMIGFPIFSSETMA